MVDGAGEVAGGVVVTADVVGGSVVTGGAGVCVVVIGGAGAATVWVGAGLPPQEAKDKSTTSVTSAIETQNTHFDIIRCYSNTQILICQALGKYYK